MKNKPIRQHVQLAPDKYSNAGLYLPKKDNSGLSRGKIVLIIIKTYNHVLT